MSDAERIAWISVSPGDAETAATIGDAFERLGVPRDGAGLDHILRVHAEMPRTLDEHLAFYRGIMREPGPLTRIEREIVGIAVSVRNQCLY